MNILQKLKFEASHTTFTLVFTVLLYIVYNAFNIEKIAKWFYLGDSIELTALIAYLVFGFSLFLLFFVLFAHRWTTKPLATILIILSASVTYFISKYNVAIDTTMVMNTVHTDSTEVGSLLSVHMIPYLLFLVILPIYIIWNVDITFHKPAGHILRSSALGVLALVVAVISLYTEFTSIQRAGNASHKYIVHSLVPVNYIRSISSIISNELKPVFASTKKKIQITGEVTRKDDLMVVLVVGETARQKNLTLYGYDRKNTNPVLSNIDGLHMLNGIARLGSTLYALPEIFEKNEIKLPTMVAKMGIETSCLVNYTLYDNCKEVGEVRVKDCKHDGKCYDEDVIPLFENKLSEYKSGYEFIVLHLGGGSHGPIYQDRHPPEYAKFKPMCTDADVMNQCTEEELYNSYDNTILYTDYVLGEIVKRLDNSGQPYVMIYLSDHGESLMEDGRIFHGMPPGIALPKEQAQVPLIVKSSLPISIAKREEYLQQDIFDTVLSLFSIKSPLFTSERNFITLQSTGEKHIESAENDSPKTSQSN